MAPREAKRNRISGDLCIIYKQIRNRRSSDDRLSSVKLRSLEAEGLHLEGISNATLNLTNLGVCVWVHATRESGCNPVGLVDARDLTV